MSHSWASRTAAHCQVHLSLHLMEPLERRLADADARRVRYDSVMHTVFTTCVLLALLAAEARADSFDVVVYGGTPGGIAAALQSSRMGKTAVLIEPTKFLGGLTTGGLGATDIGNKRCVGGISREFYGRVWKHYNDPASWQHQTREEYLASK